MPRLPSILGVALVAVSALFPTLPASAGPAENNLLASIEGVWEGRGQVTGPNGGPVACRMTFRNTAAGQLAYSGRCTIPPSGASFRGTMTYNESRGRFESASVAQGVTVTTVGRRQGNNLIFSTSGMQTRYGTASSTMQLNRNAIQMSFELVDAKGEKTATNISLSRS